MVNRSKLFGSCSCMSCSQHLGQLDARTLHVTKSVNVPIVKSLTFPLFFCCKPYQLQKVGNFDGT